MSRYLRDNLVKGTRIATSESILRVRTAFKQGSIETTTIVMPDGYRLDTLAGMILEDAKLWWVIAALSNIGWGLQVPAGTQIIVPTSKDQIEGLV